jgi:outer membrane lipoprotein-sorting protein
MRKEHETMRTAFSGSGGRTCLVAILATLSLVPALRPAAQTASLGAETILARMEANQVYRSIEYSGKMVITSGGKTRVKLMRSWAVGEDKAFIEFENPEDKGVRMLKLGKNLWMYFPKERDTVKISGHLLKEGMMGSDVSYEDAMEPGALREYYRAETAGEETIGGRNCVIVELTAKTPELAYSRRSLWIDTERFITMQTRLYARSGKLLKETRTLETGKIGGRWFPVSVEMSDKLKKDSKTVFTMTRLTLDPAIDENRFSLAALTR